MLGLTGSLVTLALFGFMLSPFFFCISPLLYLNCCLHCFFLFLHQFFIPCLFLSFFFLFLWISPAQKQSADIPACFQGYCWSQFQAWASGMSGCCLYRARWVWTFRGGPGGSGHFVAEGGSHSHTRAMGASQKWIRVAGQTGNSLEICRNSLRIVWKFAEMVWEWLGEWPQDFLSQPPCFGLYFLYLGGSNYLETILMKFQTI